EDIGLDAIDAHCRRLYAHALAGVQRVPGIRVLGSGSEGPGGYGPLSFTTGDAPAHMVARALSDGHGVCVRSGYHCAQPLHEHFQSPPSLRLSFYLYNQPWEIDR